AANASWLKVANEFTTNSLALFGVIGVTIAYAQAKKARPTNYVILSLASFLIICSGLADGNVDKTFFGALGLFSAIIISLLVVAFGEFLKKHGLKIKLPDTVPPNVAEPLEAIFVNFIIIAAAVLIRQGFVLYGKPLPRAINGLFAPLLAKGDSLWAIIVYIALLRFFWFFGIHGGNVCNAVMNPILTAYMAENIAASAAGEPIPHIFTSSFWNGMANMSVLPIVLAVYLVGKSKQARTVCNVGLVPSLFGIGEPVTFGLPLVLNFDLLLPNILANVASGVIFYFAQKLNIMGKAIVAFSGNLPVFIRPLICTLDWRSVIVSVVAFAISTLIYLPAVKRYDGKLYAQEQGNE
ncbi:MAG: PTS sugar transporter subunit IIC, partial [Erysipelotrichaceae bacterium]|nr:PTS sugar transporter subunit IIC [Erysipelotrichaceae bacterium]